VSRDEAALGVRIAREAGLHYVTDQAPGLSRIRHGKGFVYLDAHERIVRDKATLDRIRALVIPPAWTHVWISADPRAHLQVTGRDARGRKQYRYHPDWTIRRDQRKYDRMVAFGLALPEIRRRVEADLKKTPLSREFVLAVAVKLLDKTLIRVGNKEYARTNGSFGLTTLLDRHVEIEGPVIRFHFRAKSGVTQVVQLRDRTLARLLKKDRKSTRLNSSHP